MNRHAGLPVRMQPQRKRVRKPPEEQRPIPLLSMILMEMSWISVVLTEITSIMIWKPLPGLAEETQFTASMIRRVKIKGSMKVKLVTRWLT